MDALSGNPPGGNVNEVASKPLRVVAWLRHSGVGCLGEGSEGHHLTALHCSCRRGGRTICRDAEIDFCARKARHGS